MNTESPTFLLANLGSDASQLFSYLERGEEKLARSAAARAQKIISRLLQDSRLKGGKREVEILREIIADALSERRSLQVTKEELEEYFLPFSLRVLYAGGETRNLQFQ